MRKEKERDEVADAKESKQHSNSSNNTKLFSLQLVPPSFSSSFSGVCLSFSYPFFCYCCGCCCWCLRFSLTPQPKQRIFGSHTRRAHSASCCYFVSNDFIRNPIYNTIYHYYYTYYYIFFFVEAVLIFVCRQFGAAQLFAEYYSMFVCFIFLSILPSSVFHLSA